MLRSEHKSISLEQIEGYFGNEFARSMRDLTLNSDWQGPIKSAYGWHTVLLHKKKIPTSHLILKSDSELRLTHF